MKFIPASNAFTWGACVLFVMLAYIMFLVVDSYFKLPPLPTRHGGL